MGQPIFLFKTRDIPDGVKIVLQRIREPVLKDWLKELGILNDYTMTMEIDGVEYTVTQKREQTLQFHYIAEGDGPFNGKEVSERKAEIKHWKVNRKTGERSPASTARSKAINAVNERPFKKVSKNVIPAAGYFMYAWHGKKEEPTFYVERLRLLRQEAERFSKEDLAGVGSFTWGHRVGEVYWIMHARVGHCGFESHPSPLSDPRDWRNSASAMLHHCVSNNNQ